MLVKAPPPEQGVWSSTWGCFKSSLVFMQIRSPAAIYTEGCKPGQNSHPLEKAVLSQLTASYLLQPISGACAVKEIFAKLKERNLTVLWLVD